MRWKWMMMAPLAVMAAAMAADLSTAGKPQARLMLGEAAPEIAATTLDGKGTSLAAIRGANEGKIIVLQFGSITDPIFRSHAQGVERLALIYGEKAVFVVVYQREAHAADGADPLALNGSDGFNIAEPTSIAERQKLAQQAAERLHMEKEMVVVDAWSNTSSLRYGSYPNMTFVIDAKGNLQAGYPFMDPAKVGNAVSMLAAGKELPPELKGSTMRAAAEPAPFDYSAAAMDMTGGRGPAGIAAVLDHSNMTDGQRATLLPALAEYMAEVQTFRQTRQALPGAPARGPARGAAPAGGAATTGEVKVSTPQDVQQAIMSLRSSAEKLKGVIKQNLSTKDAASLYQALDAMTPAQHLFGNPG